MAKNLLVVVTSPTPGHEEEYNRWYTEQHLADVLRVPGFTAAQRFKLATHGPSGLPGSYLAIYEYETTGPTDDPQAVFTALADATRSGHMWISPAMDPTKIFVSAFTPMMEQMVSTR